MSAADPTRLSSRELETLAEEWVELAQPRLGAAVIGVSDEFFAPAERLLSPHPPELRPGIYDDHGKWMDGWESRRRRDGGHDWCVVRLGLEGVVRAVDLDTTHFTGNYPPAASIEGCRWRGEGDPGDAAGWLELLPNVALCGDAHNAFAVESSDSVTHLRLHIYPDGGVARLRVWGEVRPRLEQGDEARGRVLDLVAIENGGRAIACNDRHYGSPANLLLPGRGVDMGDGWETRRRREPGFDWAILRLGRAGVLERLEIDTAHFRGNYPDRISVRAALAGALPREAAIADSQGWATLLEPRALEPDHVHVFDRLATLGPVDHLRIEIHPDGGLSRVRAFGRPAERGEGS
ncbi:MAG TPA: allantoicase [Thermoanaerobaculia bacterium]|nr:allantoicase [Thermoanaerobaculia bacterium]